MMGMHRVDFVDEVWHRVPPRELGEGREDSLVISSNVLRTIDSENTGFEAVLLSCNSNIEQITHHLSVLKL